jgi:hypothetical protein
LLVHATSTTLPSDHTRLHRRHISVGLRITVRQLTVTSLLDRQAQLIDGHGVK